MRKKIIYLSVTREGTRTVEEIMNIETREVTEAIVYYPDEESAKRWTELIQKSIDRRRQRTER